MKVGSAHWITLGAMEDIFVDFFHLDVFPSGHQFRRRFMKFKNHKFGFLSAPGTKKIPEKTVAAILGFLSSFLRKGGEGIGGKSLAFPQGPKVPGEF